MNGSFRRNRMVSIRLSTDEYARLQDMCTSKGSRSISDLARTAMQRLIECPDEAGDLRSQMRALTVELERLSRVLKTRGADEESI